MANIAIVVIPFWGHVNVTLSVGQLLINRGHKVTWFLPVPLSGLILPEGGEIVYTNTHEQEEVNALVKLLEACKSKPALEGVKYVLEEVLLPISLRMFEPLSKAMVEYKPDLIINDEQTYSGALCAYVQGVPSVTTHPAPSGIFENSNLDNILEWYFGLFRSLQKELNIESPDLHYISKDLGLAFSPKVFSDTNDLLPQQKFVGPCIDVMRNYNDDFDFSLVAARDKKNILVSIGTLLTGEADRIMNQIVSDFGDSDHTIIVAADPAIREDWPDNFIVRKRVPHLKLLQHIDVIISHGGANTVCDAIGMGIPIVVIPMAYDQYYVGDQVQENGLGYRFKYKRLRKNDLQKAVDTLLEENNAFEPKITEYARKFKEAGGATKACDLIEDFLNVTNSNSLVSLSQA